MMQQPQHAVFSASPTTIQPTSASRPSFVQRRLPDRNVTADSIEEAYVGFILCCNPGVSGETDTAALREAFQNPPKSGGKSFSTFALFELLKKLESKELKTWVELALKLGVEPPDQEKGESSQKIQQYAVRLKRWMHSMHVDAFFEYLMDRRHPYWTEIPSDPNPVSEYGRDGVAAEDDMALRALMPQIKPRRGRRKAEDDETNKSPGQRPSPLPDEQNGGARHGGMDLWSAQPDVGRGSVFQFPVSDPLRLSAPMSGYPSGAPPPWHSNNNDVAQTPLSAYPQIHSAITPVTRNAFWAEEPKSAITPSKPRSMSRRHGAKVLSSAWRSGGGTATGKARGRPPINRMGGNSDGPFSAFPATSDMPTFKLPSPIPENRNGTSYTQASTNPPEKVPRPAPPIAPPTAPPPLKPPLPPILTQSPVLVQSPIQASPVGPSPISATASSQRPAKRSRLSLQVPQRVGGQVRLATPPLPSAPLPPLSAPPVVMVNGQVRQGDTTPATDTVGVHPLHSMNRQATPVTAGSVMQTPISGLTLSTRPPQPQIPPAYGPIHHTPHQPQPQTQGISFQDPTDRTNMREVEGYFMHEILTGDWYDAKGNSIPVCSVEEGTAITQTVIENLLKTAATKETFLINLAALAGGKFLMNTNRLRITRLEEGSDRNRYSCAWELRLGDIRGSYSMEETVMHDRWKKKKPDPLEKDKDDRSPTAGADDPAATKQQRPEATEDLHKKYTDMLSLLEKRDRQLNDLRIKVMGAIKDPRGDET
ncbi:ARS binding protein 2-domain-containing protein [Diplogelasinospora grovesii]|uniref:ARS binding protein 2-domain-containing protein n=1 Tax=Diplogelasinospora grovesii TaxID=303347 RepID=A0AAN6NET3_9PEZI|nr:ARS binding protein 2-domain-containing protein [Diplogelasinospora grovesii]